jgi:hypothetical protein
MHGATHRPGAIRKAARSAFSLGLAVVMGTGCARTLAPLRGAPVPPSSIPRVGITGTRQITFRWEYNEESIVARGEGVARLASPDSARLDFFVDGGFGNGHVLVFGDRVIAPGGDMVAKMIPSPPMLWAAVGRLAVPPSADTTAAVDGSRLRADIGSDPGWRATFEGARLISLEHVEGGHVTETVTRASDGTVRYSNPGTRRTLRITVTREEEVASFDASIWRP